MQRLRKQGRPLSRSELTVSKETVTVETMKSRDAHGVLKSLLPAIHRMKASGRDGGAGAADGNAAAGMQARGPQERGAPDGREEREATPSRSKRSHPTGWRS